MPLYLLFKLSVTSLFPQEAIKANKTKEME